MTTAMTEKQCHYVEPPALGEALQPSGLPININRNVEKESKTLLDLNNGSLYVTQGKENLCTILNETRSDSIMRHHIRYATEAHKIEVGLPQYVFSNCLPPLERSLTPTWITYTWQFKDKYGILVE